MSSQKEGRNFDAVKIERNRYNKSKNKSSGWWWVMEFCGCVGWEDRAAVYCRNLDCDIRSVIVSHINYLHWRIPRPFSKKAFFFNLENFLLRACLLGNGMIVSLNFAFPMHNYLNKIGEFPLPIVIHYSVFTIHP